MSTIGGVSGANSAWTMQRSQHQAKMFNKVDTDTSGGVDATELTAFLKEAGDKSGVAVEDSQALFQQMDSNSDGSLSSDELAQGLKQVLPPPPSTVNFAQSRGGKGDGALSETEFEAGRPAPPEGAEQAQKPGGLQGPLGIGDPPPAGAQPNTTASTDPLDTNQDGVVSELERLAGALKTLSTADTSGNEALSEMAKLVQQLDQQISTSWLATQSTSTLNTTA